ncbi:hypothetical protein C0989_011693 [Termitomyces sp. Mn162]|nr:hypothetical protein C0989_011693 [Termitomyces sp. Mn162]
MLPRLTEGAVNSTMNKKTFETFRIELEGRPITPESKIHDSGHRAVGGDMGDTYSSPGALLRQRDTSLLDFSDWPTTEWTVDTDHFARSYYIGITWYMYSS